MTDAADCLNVRYSTVMKDHSWLCNLIGRSSLIAEEFLAPERFVSNQRQHVLSKQQSGREQHDDANY
jgi:hypothetical protein